MDYTYLIGQSVIGYPESKITEIDNGVVTFYFRNGDELVTETKDLSQINVQTIAD